MTLVTTVHAVQDEMSLIGLGGALLGTEEDSGDGVLRGRATGVVRYYATSCDIGWGSRTCRE